MATKRERREQFLKENPYCIFCGENSRKTTKEHSPPRCLFFNKHRPKSHEFNACYKCNNGSREQDLVVSFLTIASSNVFNDFDRAKSDYLDKLMIGVSKYAKWVLDMLEEESGQHYVLKDGDWRRTAKIMMDKRLVVEVLEPWAAKTAIALWSEQTCERFNENYFVSVNWITNASTLKGSYPAEVASALKKYSSLKQGSWNTADQFQYIFDTAEENLFVVLAEIHLSHLFLASIGKIALLDERPELRSWNNFTFNKEERLHKILQAD